jgi:hypothetical protein
MVLIPYDRMADLKRYTILQKKRFEAYSKYQGKLASNWMAILDWKDVLITIRRDEREYKTPGGCGSGTGRIELAKWHVPCSIYETLVHLGSQSGSSM